MVSISANAVVPIRRPISRLAVLMAVALLGACAQLPVKSTAERDASFAPYRETHIGDETVAHFLAARTGVIIAAVELTFDQDPHDPHRIGFRALDGIGRGAQFGSAAAIDPRGYFLTAAHVVRQGPLTVLFNDGAFVRHCPARVVWIGDHAPGHPDLALVHIDAKLPATFTWSGQGAAGDAVFAAGLNYGDKEQPRFDLGFVAGHLEKVPKAEPRPEATVDFTARLPLHPGDSGGPLVDAEGGLLGINGVIKYDFTLLFGLPGRLTDTPSVPTTVG